jgi:hypothetical protein
MKQNFHIGIMGNLFSGKTTSCSRWPAIRLAGLETLLDGAEIWRVLERGQEVTIDECTRPLLPRSRREHLPHRDWRSCNADAAAAEIRHLMTRERAGRHHHQRPAVRGRPRGLRSA